jgi:hypothetical protein
MPLLGIYPKECDSVYSKGTCTPMFIVALFTLAKYGNSQDAPLPTNGLRKCDIYSATKKNKILSFTSKWIELENFILREVSQAQKAKNCMFSLICR